MKQRQSAALLFSLVFVLSACGSTVDDNAIPASGVEIEPVASEQPIVDFATPESEYLPVLAEVGEPTGGGSIGAFPSDLSAENGELVLRLSHSTGCGSFHHLALVETAVLGTYELFHDTDNSCEAAALGTFKIAPSDLVAADDGTITIGGLSVAFPGS